MCVRENSFKSYDDKEKNSTVAIEQGNYNLLFQ